jgi:hypothetical protein
MCQVREVGEIENKLAVNVPFFILGTLPCLLAAGAFLMVFDTLRGFCGMLAAVKQLQWLDRYF